MRKILIIAFATLIPSLVFAQGLPRPKPLTGDIKKDFNIGDQSSSTLPATDDKVLSALAKPFQDLANFINSDAIGAAQLAIAIPELQDGTGLTCWNAFQTAGKVFKAHPVPLTFKAMTDFQALRLIVMATNKLCDEPACTIVFSDGVNIAQAAAPIALPVIPSLSQLCSKVAHIKLSVPTQADLDALKAVTNAPSSTNP